MPFRSDIENKGSSTESLWFVPASLNTPEAKGRRFFSALCLSGILGTSFVYQKSPELQAFISRFWEHIQLKVQKVIASTYPTDNTPSDFPKPSIPVYMMRDRYLYQKDKEDEWEEIL